MNKLLVLVLVLGAGAFLYFLANGNHGAAPDEVEMPDDVSVEELQEALKDEGKRTVYGSCNAIAKASNCIDYVGSMWDENNMAELNCEGVGTFSKNTCPYSEFGGCQTSAGTVMEIIAWSYKEGPGGYDEESLPYAIASCNSLPMAQWVAPEAAL